VKKRVIDSVMQVGYRTIDNFCLVFLISVSATKHFINKIVFWASSLLAITVLKEHTQYVIHLSELNKICRLAPLYISDVYLT